MKSIKAIFLIFGLSFLVQAQTYISAEDAIRIGLENNFEIRIARNNQAIAEKNAGLGTSGFLPSLDISAGIQNVCK